MRLLFFLLCFTACAAYGQPMYVSPEKPRCGDTLRLVYDPSHPEAMLKGTETLYLSMQASGIYKQPPAVILTMQMNDGKWTTEYVLPDEAVSFTHRVYTLSNMDWKVPAKHGVYDADGKPVRGAYLVDINADSFKKEITAYPDNYLAYGLYLTSCSPEPYGNREEELKRYYPLIQSLYQKKKTRNDLGVLYSVCVMETTQGNREAAADALGLLIDLYPESPYAFDAIDYYQYYFFSTSEPLLRFWSGVEKYPQSYFARKSAGKFVYYNTCPAEVFGMVLSPLIKADTLDAKSRKTLGVAYAIRNYKPDSAIVLLREAIRIAFTTNFQHEGNYGNEFVREKMYDIYYWLAKACLQSGKYEEAFGAASSAMLCLQGTNSEFAFRGSNHALLGASFLGMKNYDQASQEFMTAHLWGDTTAFDSLYAIHRLQTGSDEGVDGFLEYWASETKKLGPNADAPEFTVQSLAGDTICLSELKGKVVVINFWATSCRYCVDEMPMLNGLVKHYADKEVVFLGISLENPEPVRVFLKNHVFDYTICVNGGNAQRKFVDCGTPLHIVVDPQGKMIFKQLGTSPDLLQKLRHAINRGLKG